jgi:hypothetical protein
MWWVKFTSAVAAFIISCAGAAKILGVSIDLQTKTAAHAEQASLRQEIRDDQTQIIMRLEAKVDRLGERIDVAMASISRGKHTSKEQ